MAALAPYRAYLAILRPTNLVIVGLTQWLLYFFILRPCFVNTQSSLDILIWLFIIDTIIIAGCGYLINDIYDVKIDQINKPDKAFIPVPIKLNSAWNYYYGLNILGFGIAGYIAFSIKNLPYLVIYPIAVGVLYLYSSRYKNSVLIGNILVSIYVAMVPGILLVYAKDEIAKMNIYFQAFIFFGFGCNMIFSFLINLSREIVKDMEDIDGDKQNGLITLPIAYGIQLSKNIIIGLLSTSILGLCLVWFVLDMELDLNLDYFLGIALLVVLILMNIYKIRKAKTILDYHYVSSFLKIILLIGLIFFLLDTKILITQWSTLIPTDSY